MKTVIFLSVLVAGAFAASGQSTPGRTPPPVVPRTSPAPAPNPGTGSGSGAEYVQVDVAPSATGTTANTAGGRRSRQRNRGGAQYVGVSVAPRR